MTEIPAIDPSVILWSSPEAATGVTPLLVLLHGYGSHEGDLFGLAPYLPAGFDVAALRAPLNTPFPAPGFAWYPISSLEDRDPASITAAAEAVLAWLDATVDSTRPVGLLGFSQGAAVSIQVLRLRPDRVSFVVNLAGYAAAGSLDTDEALRAIKPPLFWGRGARDEVIPQSLIDHTVQWLPDYVDLTGRVYAGLTHSVSQEELDDVAAFLAAQLAALAPTTS